MRKKSETPEKKKVTNWRGEKNVIHKRDYPFKFQLWEEPLVLEV